VNAEFVASLREEIRAMVEQHVRENRYLYIVARESSTETREKHEQERTMLRNRQTIRGKEAIVLSTECVDRTCGDCTDPDCCCECHRQDEERDEEESP
jgi:hypothetical protein